MRKFLLAVVVTAGLFTLTAASASAAPVSGLASVRPALTNSLVNNVDWYRNHRHWHHRYWRHHQWRYW